MAVPPQNSEKNQLESVGSWIIKGLKIRAKILGVHPQGDGKHSRYSNRIEMLLILLKLDPHGGRCGAR